jgi:ABC-2 type transport system permease protein
MFKLIYYETLKTFLKWRTYIGFIAIGVLIPLIEIGMKLEGRTGFSGMTRGLQQDFFFVGNLYNGWFIGHMIMFSLFVHIPFLISLVAGDVLAGEATAGTFRLLLIRPVSRTRILLAKYAATLFYTFTFVIFLAVISLGLGLPLFGSGDLLTFDVSKDLNGGTLLSTRGILVIPQTELLLRFLLAYGLALLAMWVVASLAFLFSALVENAIGPIVGTMAIVIGCYILNSLPYSFFDTLKPFLFTTYMNVWQKAFTEPIEWQEILQWSAYLGCYCFGFFTITWYVFTRRDILS